MPDLPLTLPRYLDDLAPTTLENNSRILKVNQIKDFDHVVRLELKCTNSNFRLPPGLRDLIWRERHVYL